MINKLTPAIIPFILEGQKDKKGVKKSSSNIKENKSGSNLDKKALGGPIDNSQDMARKKMSPQQIKGNLPNALTDYSQGKSHQNGGIKVPGHDAEVEKGETKMGKYVFSNRGDMKLTKSLANQVGLDTDYSGKTFADASKEIDKKYDKREYDAYDNNAKEREFDALEEAQEIKRNELKQKAQEKAEELQQEEEFANGGSVAGSTAQGAMSGAATGASIGGVPGAIVGGVVGGGASYLKASSAHDAAEEQGMTEDEQRRLKYTGVNPSFAQEEAPNVFAKGGDLEEYETGGEYQDGGPFIPGLNPNPRLNQNFHPGAPGSAGVTPLEQDTFGGGYDIETEGENRVSTPIQEISMRGREGDNSLSQEGRQTELAGDGMREIPEAGNDPEAPEGSTNPYTSTEASKIGQAAQFAKPLVGAIQRLDGTEETSFPRISPNLVDYSDAVDQAEQQAAKTRAHASDAIQENANTAGQVLQGNIQADVSAQEKLNKAISQLETQEQNQNAQIRNKFSTRNQQIGMREEIAQQKDRAARRQKDRNIAGEIGRTAAGITKENKMFDAQNLQNRTMINMLQEMYPGVSFEFDEKGNIVPKVNPTISPNLYGGRTTGQQNSGEE